MIFRLWPYLVTWNFWPRMSKFPHKMCCWILNRYSKTAGLRAAVFEISGKIGVCGGGADSSPPPPVRVLTLSLVGGRGVERPPYGFFVNNSRKTRWIAAKLPLPSHWSFGHMSWKIVTSWGVRSRSYDVICQVMSGRNRRILRSVASGRVSLLPGVFFVCIAGSIIGVMDI